MIVMSQNVVIKFSLHIDWAAHWLFHSISVVKVIVQLLWEADLWVWLFAECHNFPQ